MEIRWARAEELTDDELLEVRRLALLVHEDTAPEEPFRGPDEYLAYQRTPRAELHRVICLARDGARLVGLGWVFWSLLRENAHLAKLNLEVAPAHRRRGVATRLLAEAAAHAQAAGRPLLQSWTTSRVPAGEEFCRALGARAGLVVDESRLQLQEVDRDLLRGWIAAGEALPDFDLLPAEPPHPAGLLEAAAALAGVMNTAPRDALEEEDQTITPEMLARSDEAMLAGGNRIWRLYARHLPTGRLVGYTEVDWKPGQPAVVSQGNTGVLPEHRGHGLAKWLKGAMLLKVLDEIPGAATVVTGNALSNDAMLAINRALGFRPFAKLTVWELETGSALGYTSRQSARLLE